ncbi:hypothetical protein QM012_002366 [Aureobasidium pullulans]|uniref:BZIP domain-containing protein n=1 Tax=Aureobasidium pullulans TaxID=5580 RepID=A0ABR0TBQ6_AURPU
MARNRASVQKRCNFEGIRRRTRRERLHQLCVDAANASVFNHNWMMDPPLTFASDWHPNRNQFEPLAHLQDRKSRWFANRHSRCRRARGHKRKELIDFELATLDADLSSRFDHVIGLNEHNFNVQLPDLDLSPMQMVKWQPPLVSPVLAPASRLQHISDKEWSTLEIKFSPPVKQVPAAPCPSPPMSFMTAAELGLPSPLTPKVCLSELDNSSQASSPASANVSIVKPWISAPPAIVPIDQDPPLPTDTPEDDGVGSPFVAAKLPQFRDIDPFDLTISSTLDVRPSTYEHTESPSQPTRCARYREKGGHDTEGASLNTFQSLRNYEKGRMAGLVYSKSVNSQAFALDVDWIDDPIVDWPHDVLGDWNDEPSLGWNVEPLADWVDEPIDDCLDDLVMIEHDDETLDWTLLSDDRALSDCVSTLSSAFSSMEVLPLPSKDSSMEDSSAYEDSVRELAEDEVKLRRVSKSAWESESDFCIPAFF